MALSSSTVFEVRTTGSDSNGGGFVTGASGTDFSQQATAQFALTGLTTVAANAIILSASAVTTMVGNLINITGGTNFITGIYQITAVSAGVSITVDRNCTTAAGAAGVGNVGGALLTPAKLLAQLTVGGMQAWVQAGTYSIATGLATSAGIVPGTGFIRVRGYNTVRGDCDLGTTLTRPLFQLTASVPLITDANGGFRFENLTLNGNGTSGNAFSITGLYTTVFNCRIVSFNPTAQRVVLLGANGVTMAWCELTLNTGNFNIVLLNGASNVYGCNFHDNTSVVALILVNGFSTSIEDSLFVNNVGVSAAPAIQNNFIMSSVRRCTFFNNNGDAITNTVAYDMFGEISNNIIYGNAGFGLNLSILNPSRQDCLVHHNAVGGNTSGSYNGIQAGNGDVALTANPFVNSSGGNFSLNQVAGGGKLCRQAGWPGTMVGGTDVGYVDIGALQAPTPTTGYTSAG